MIGQAIVAVDKGKVELREVEVPPLGEWDIRIQLEATAVSAGTESHIINTMASAEDPGVLGYAPIGHIEDIGDQAKTLFALGDRVSYFGATRAGVGPGYRCGGHLSHGILNVNPQTRDLLGPDQYCIKLPDGLASEHAAFGGIAAVSSMGATMPGTKPGDKVLVLGGGVIGQFAAQHFRMHGAEVALCDLHTKRLDAARACGADHIIDAAQQDTVEAVREFWPDGADIVSDTTGSYRVVEASVGALKRRGKFVFLGWCKGSDFNLERFHGQNVFEAFFPWTLEPAHVQHSWRMMLQGGLRVDPVISHRGTLDQVSALYNMILTTPEKHVGVVFNWA